MIFADCETCGLCGPAVLIQYAVDDGSIHLYSPWIEPIGKTLALFENFCSYSSFCGFNLTFDWFNYYKLYTMFEKFPRDWIPIDHLKEIADYEEFARDCKVVIKPVKALDLMLHSRKGPFQKCMNRENIIIKRVPTQLAWQLAAELEKRIPLSEILFARRKIKREHFEVEDIENDLGVMDPNFKNIILRFDASTALKNLAMEALGSKVIFHSEISLDKALYPFEVPYAPFCQAAMKENKYSSLPWKDTWPDKIKYHINHWTYNQKAREYATQDVEITRGLYNYFKEIETIEAGDDDSELAIMVACVRWRGFKINIEKVKAVKQAATDRKKDAPIDPGACRRWLEMSMSEAEKIVMQGSTAKPILEEISKWDDSPIIQGKAKAIIAARQANDEIKLCDKLLLAGRFHASFKVIGTLSSRMAGTDGINPQGINRLDRIRECFEFAFDGETLMGGDFSGFEVSIAEAVFNDVELRKVLQSGKKIHALLGMELFNKTYEEIIESEHTENDLYDKGKRGIFLMIYGGTSQTMFDKGIAPSVEIAEKALRNFGIRFPGIAEAKKKTFNDHCSMRQPNGIGTKVIWHDPKEFVDCLLDFKRYFTIENQICKALFDLANDPPKEWKGIKLKVIRRDREQTISGAIQSALYAAAFNIQAQNLRAAENHRIQATGGKITKHVQRRMWDLQKPGINRWVCLPCNIHDEILGPVINGNEEKVKKIVLETVEEFRSKIPLIKMEYGPMKNWAGKGK